MWWTKKNDSLPLPLSRVDYPYGTCVETETGAYLIRDGFRLKMLTDRVVDNWALPVVMSTDKAVMHLPVRGNLGFRDGALIKDVSDGKVYLIAHNKRRHVVTPDLELYGIKLDSAILVSKEEVEIHPKGDDLR